MTEQDIISCKIVSSCRPAPNGLLFKTTEVFITFIRLNRVLVAYSRLAYDVPANSEKYEIAAFLRRMNRD